VLNQQTTAPCVLRWFELFRHWVDTADIMYKYNLWNFVYETVTTCED